MRLLLIALVCVLLAVSAEAAGIDGNRLTYLDESDPYYVSRTFPRLTTPQWIGEAGVDAVLVLAIDDMREHRRYEAMLRPTLERLKRIDGRAPISIMTNQIDPALPQLQQWLKEGLSLEIHTIDHPCPLLAGNDFAKAKSNYDRCVDLLSSVPGNRPVAFRMPCCDSLNTPSPRFFSEIFNKVTEKGRFLTIDSSVFNIITPNDADLPRELVFEPDGRERFRKYVPFDSFVNTIEDYPYPYPIGRLCWEFACVTPSDWQAQNIQKPNNPHTVEDMNLVIDATVMKQGTFTLVFHPHGWIRSDQVPELVEHAAGRYGKKVKFLNFREAQDRLDRNLLAGQPLRAENGQDNGVRLIDLNNDGFLDVVIGNEKLRQTRVWSPKNQSWIASDFPVAMVNVDDRGNRSDAGVRFGVFRPDGHASIVVRSERVAGVWHFDGGKWVEDKAMLNGLEIGGEAVFTARQGRDLGVRLRDLDHDGCCELIDGNPGQQAVFAWRPEQKSWVKLQFSLPAGTALVDALGRDAGLRFVDINQDGFDDVIFSNEDRYAFHLFGSMQDGWSRPVTLGRRGDKGELPMITRSGTSNGAWFHSRQLWVQNEDTAMMPNLVDHCSYNDLLAQVDPGPRSPDAALKSMRVKPGFEIELVAAEPLVEDPVAFAWGSDGKLWVVEMGDYPLGVDGKGAPGGRVKYLQDTDGDGKYDKATLFLDGLSFPTGVMPWGKGVLVTAAPEIFYAEDTDGDGKADVRRALFTGFGKGNQQHRVNGLVWGLDNWVYCANGHSGGRIKSEKTGASISINGRDFRIRPDEGLLDPQTGQTQFGRSQDDWGNWFGCDNINPMFQMVLPDHYLRRNPHVAPPEPRLQISKVPGAAPVYPISRTPARFNDLWAENHFTSANSIIVYRDELFGPTFVGNSFVSEPVHNLVHREVMYPLGVAFTSQRASGEERSEFLASTDNWCRPTMIKTGPDGALWVADMYRYVIEHPEWIPKDWQKRLDLRAGHDKGRIYRVYPVGARPRPIPRLDRLDTAGLVAALDSPNGWQRDTVQQLLVQTRDPAAVPLLKKLATDNRRPLCRLQALCTLDGIGALDAALLQRALGDADPGVRRHAVRLCEALLAGSPELGAAMAKLVADPDPQVRMQLAFSLGLWDHAQAGAALAHLAIWDAGDRFISAAVISSLTPKNLEAVVSAVLSTAGSAPVPPGLLQNLLRTSTGMHDNRSIAIILTAVAAPTGGNYIPWQYGALAGVLDALEQSGIPLNKLAQEASPELKLAIGQLSGIFASARAIAADPKAPGELRVMAIPLLGRGLEHQKEEAVQLSSFLAPQTAQNLQSAVIATIARLPDPQVPQILLRGWKGYGPELRLQVLDVLLGRSEWIDPLFDAIEHHQILPLEFDAMRRQRLLQHRFPAVRERAAKVFADVVSPDRQKVMDAFQPALALEGNATNGGQIFDKTCAVCHKLRDLGHEVGPDLASLGDRSPESLLTAILDPNRAVESRYTNYVADTRNGVTVTGIIAAETGSSITLLTANGESQTILRTDLKAMRSTGTSLMPEGLESGYQPQDIADLIAYIRASGPPPKRKTFDGNNPHLVQPGGDGSILLASGNCEIYGTTLVLEKQYGNLGYWSSEDDQAVWSVDVAKAGKYSIRIEYACADESAGNTFVLQIGSSRLLGKVAGTGNWDTYRLTRIGELTLQAGRQRAVFRSSGKVAGSLIDLKSIELEQISKN